MNSKGTKAMLGLCLLALPHMPSLRLIGDVCAALMRYLGEGPLALRTQDAPRSSYVRVSSLDRRPAGWGHGWGGNSPTVAVLVALLTPISPPEQACDPCPGYWHWRRA